MKWIAFVLAAAALAVPAGQASAAGPTTAQFNALKKQVAKQQKQITTLNNAVNAAFAYMVCLTATTSDALQGEWQALDANLTALGRPAVFGPQAPINDVNACQALRIARSHNIPPNAAGFGALTALLGPSYRYSALSLLLS